MAAKWQRVRIDVPSDLNPRQREKLAEGIIEFIQERTTVEQRDKNGASFPPYSAEYAKRTGVSINDVDLFFTGEMLMDLELISHKSGSVLIGYERGSDSNAKADGNIRGTYGKPRPIPGKQRDFLGIDPLELQALIRRTDLNDD